MNEEPTHPAPSRDEARAALTAIDALRTETRRSIAGSEFGPNMIWCGLLWIMVFGYAQFRPGGSSYWVFLAVFFVGRIVTYKLRPRPVKRVPNWRMVAFWLVIIAYGGLFLALLEPWDLLKHLSSADTVIISRKIAAYLVMVFMLGYVLMGLWVSRFFVGLGLIVTALVLAGYYFVPEWYNLWMGVVGGGTFIVSGVFIRKFWK